MKAARRALAAPVPLLGAVALAGTGFILEAKRAPGVELIVVNVDLRIRQYANSRRVVVARDIVFGGLAGAVLK